MKGELIDRSICSFMKDNDILQRFGEYSIKLAELLKEGRRLDTDELIFIENHLLIVQLAMAMSKIFRRRNRDR